MKSSARTIGVIGHRNPDTDSVCSAIAYARLKSRMDPERSYIPLRAGDINNETAYVLEYFGVPVPTLCPDVRAQVQDIDIRQIPGVSGLTTIRSAWETMRDEQISTLPVTDSDNRLIGLITLKDLAMANMDNQNTRFLADTATPYRNILSTLGGTMITGDENGCVASGKIVVGAASPEVIEEVVKPGDLVILANRYEAQYCAIEAGASCIIVCTGSDVPKSIVHLAEEHGCAVISTPWDTYPATSLMSQCIPIRSYMLPKEKILSFRPDDAVEDVREVMGKYRYVYFPIVDDDNRYIGVISRRNLLNLRRKQLILVDHNEKTQCVEGFDEADILEIIDHHRIGNLETGSPVYFRNQPVGCTATIVYQMYRESGLAPETQTAGLLLSAILSDTLKFQSPTCTAQDVSAAESLAALADVDIDALAQSMFEAGESLEGKTAEELFLQDYKISAQNGLRFGIGAGSFISSGNYETARVMVTDYLKEHADTLGVDMAFFMLTSIKTQSTLMLASSEEGKSLICRAFSAEFDPGAGGIPLPGVVSRKKQVVPQILRALQED